MMCPTCWRKQLRKGNNSDSSGESDTKKSGYVSNVLKETVMKENNSDRSVTEHEKKSEGVRNDSQKTIKDISNGYNSAEQDKKNEPGVSGNSEDRNESRVVSNEVGNIWEEWKCW